MKKLSFYNVKITKKIVVLFSMIGILFLGINYTFCYPTKINAYVTANVYSEPANSYFEDDNFYKCVVYAYNNENGTDLPYTVDLDESQLTKINNVKCDYGWAYGCVNGNCDFTISDRISSLAGLEKLTNLKYLSLSGHSLTQLNIDSNNNLETLIASRNELETINLKNNTYLHTIDLSDNVITDIDVTKQLDLQYLLLGSNLLTSIDITNNVLLKELYLGPDYWDLKGNGIHFGEKNQLSNLDISNNVNLEVLNVVDNNLSELDISNNTKLTVINVSGNKLSDLNIGNLKNLNSLYAFENELTSLDVSNNTNLKVLSIASNKLTELDVSNNTLLNILSIGRWCKKYNGGYTCGGNEIKQLDLSNNTNINELYIDYNPFVIDKYIYKGNYIVSDNVINLPENIEYSVESITSDNSLEIEETSVNFNNVGIYEVSANYSHNLSESHNGYSGVLNYHVIEATSTKFSINEEESYIYTGNIVSEEDILNNVNINYGEKEIVDNKFVIKYKDKIIKQFDIVNISSDEFIDTGKIYIANKSILEIENNIEVNNAEIFISDDKIEIKKNNIILDTFKLFSINFNNIKVFEKNITVSNNTLYNEFVENITITDGLTYKLFDGAEEVTSGIIDRNLMLKIYYDSKEIDSYTVTDTDEYLIIDDSINVDDDNMYLSNIDFDTNVNVILNKIYTTGEVTIKNKDNEVITDNDLIGTGSVVSIKLNKGSYDYTMIIYGDVDGDGVLKLSDIMKIANFTYKNKSSLTGVFEMAADFDNNGTHNLQDIMKSAKALYGGK